MNVLLFIAAAIAMVQADVCVDSGEVSPDTCLAWKSFGFCYKGNKAMDVCCATCKSDKVWPGTNDEMLEELGNTPAEVMEALEPADEVQDDSVCVDTGKVSADTCLAWKKFGFCYKGNKAQEWCCATCKSDKVWPGTSDQEAPACKDDANEDTCKAWKHFGFCYEGNKAMRVCKATCGAC